jgi:hypothetical protein
VNAIQFIQQAQSGTPDAEALSQVVMAESKNRPDEAIARARQKLIGIAQSRIEGKEFNERRPPTAMNLKLGDTGGIAAQLKPIVGNSPEGWKVTGLTMRLDVGSSTLHLDVRPDGSLRGTRWTIKTAPEMLEVARQLLRAFDRGIAHVLAAVHRGSCMVCGKGLTDPQSRAHGIGPECIRYFFVRHERAAAQHEHQEQAEDLAAEVARIRRAIQDQHPDRNPDSDPYEVRELIRALAAVKKKIEATKN